ncbi:MAG: type I DNA topoisomerase [Defluviitaleaceae bacterium]|nr:type I DNA topoisomerase [Defluviitaleaceae bacterium]
MSKVAEKKPAKKTAVAKNLVIVESPAKAKTLKKFLGSGYKIEASMGHVRDLPKSELGIFVEQDFEPKYITIRGKGDLLAKLRKEAKAAKMVYLATDPDREGEAISWHLIHALKVEPEKTARISFNEITESAVKDSIKNARPLDMDLVDAQQARRTLDRVVGYKISPLLWKKVKKGLSAGRVQSVALKIICDREEEIENFTPEEYWSIEATVTSAKSRKQFEAKYHGTGDKKVKLTDKASTDKVLKDIEKAEFVVKDVKKSQRSRKPQMSFTTSTLQQEAGKELNFAARKTMMVAQQLYEGVEVAGFGTVGLVTYIRTDSTRISDEAFTAGKEYVVQNFGADYAVKNKPEPKSTRRTQDAHEAIRPSYIHITPEMAQDSLSKDQFRLYRLIWRRFMASIMTPAVFDTVAVKIAAGKHIFNANGSILKFEGYKKVYMTSEDKEEDIKALPELEEGEAVKPVKIAPNQHFTQPPPRYSEATLVKALEENGVGRPSTYAPTIATLTARGYVSKEQKNLYPTELGDVVNNIMAENFEQIVDTEFTAKMEETLDAVELGELAWKDILRDFYYPFEEKVNLAAENIGEVEIRDEETDVLCEHCGRNMVIKFGRYGRFLACPGFPECRNAKPLFEDAGVDCPACKEKGIEPAPRIMVKKSKKGRVYYGCEKHPECEFVSWNKPTGSPCPQCGQPLVEKGTKTKKISCVDEKGCGYFTAAKEE